MYLTVMRNAQEVIEKIHGSYLTGSKNGLENTRRLLEALRFQWKTPAIHIAGTNGKGSVCAMLESVLRHAGYHTGLYTSPFLQSYHERIRLDGVPISDEKLMKYGNPVIDASQRLAQGEDVHLTPFEHGTGLALTAMQGEKVDVAILEVGLGGRLDPTNVITPNVCGITAIGYDHMRQLGDTLTAIAGEKAGIIKLQVPVVCQVAPREVREVFARVAQEKNAPLYQLTEKMLLDAECTATGSTAAYQLDGLWKNVHLSLPGEHQLMNAMTVLAIIEELRKQAFHIPDEAVYEGLSATVWPARLEWCGNILLDGAHNGHGIAALSRFVTEHLSDKKRVLLTGVMADKMSENMLQGLRTLADKAVTVRPENHRAMTAQDYAALLHSAGMEAESADTMEEALQRARQLAGEDGIIIACGSLYFAGEMRNALGLAWR